MSNDGKTEYVRVNIAVNLTKEKVNFHTLLAFGNLTQILTTFEKGQLVLVSGDFEIEEYITKTGDKKTSSTITVKRILKIQTANEIEE